MLRGLGFDQAWSMFEQTLGLDRMPDVEIEEWVGEGHRVHLVDPERFAKRLLRFVDHCASA